MYLYSLRHSYDYCILNEVVKSDITTSYMLTVLRNSTLRVEHKSLNFSLIHSK